MTKRLAIAIVTIVAALFCAGCVADENPGAAGPRTFDAQAVAITVDTDGTILWASIEGAIADEFGESIAEVEVSTEGQRGLVGLAVAPDGRLFAGAIDADERLVVLEINRSGDDHRTVWSGPETVRGGNGGRIIALDDGDLLLGVGLLNDRDGQADPNDPTGKLVRLDPDGPADQIPAIESGPWNNPFAFVERTDGSIWVADNHPQDGDERLARGDAGIDPDVVAVMPADSAPTGMASVGDELIVCAYNTGALHRYSTDGELLGSLADDCLLDVELVAPGFIAYSTGQTVVVIEAP